MHIKHSENQVSIERAKNFQWWWMLLEKVESIIVFWKSNWSHFQTSKRWIYANYQPTNFLNQIPQLDRLSPISKKKIFKQIILQLILALALNWGLQKLELSSNKVVHEICSSLFSRVSLRPAEGGKGVRKAQLKYSFRTNSTMYTYMQIHMSSKTSFVQEWNWSPEMFHSHVPLKPSAKASLHRFQ